MEHVLLVIEVLIAIALIAIILIQRSDSDGFGLGSGSGANLLSGRATANLLTRTTAILAGLFMINALLLSVIAAHNRPASIVDTIEKQETSDTPVVPTVPLAGAEKKTPAAAADKKAAAPATTIPAGEAAPVAAPAKKPVVKPAEAPQPAPETKGAAETNQD